MTVAKNDPLVFAERSQSHPMSSDRRRRTAKRPSCTDSSSKIDDSDNKKPESWSSQTTASENYDHTKPFIPPTTLKTESKVTISPAVIKKKGAEMRGTIAPSRRQKQLMRQVSGLGLEDPVFGDNDNSMGKEHASFFFDDMDIHAVPEDMRDMCSLASDRTDVVKAEEGQSLNESKSSDLMQSAYSNSSAALLSSTSSLMLPLGLEPGAAMAPRSSNTLRATSSKPKGKVPENLTLHESAHQSFVSCLSYVPPSGSFRIKTTRNSKMERRNSSASTIVLEDKNLAAQVNAMLSMNESENSFSSPCQTHATSSHRQAHKLKPTREDNLLSTCSSKYVPPPLPLSAATPIQESERFLPESMDDIFPTERSGTGLKMPFNTPEKSKKKSKDKTKIFKENNRKSG